LDHASGHVILDTSCGVGRLAIQSLLGIYSQAEQLNGEDSGQIVFSTLGLVSAAIQQVVRQSSCRPQSTQHSRLHQLKAFIENNLHDESLSLQSAAVALDISPRYLNKVFEAEGDSFMRWTWNRRLERAREMLSASLERQNSITDIAFSCGFKNLSHFSRAFRERFGCPPSLVLHRSKGATKH
jgi:AraC-like DNA-binding protein